MSGKPVGSPASRTRFAPSPTGPLHLGHAFSALTAAARGETFLLRIEDIDRQRSKPEWEAQIRDDLHWLGLDWPEPVLRQSDRLPAYRAALQDLWDAGLLYPCSCNRRDILDAASAPQEGAPLIGPDGMIYPGTCRHKPRTGALPDGALRLDVGSALGRVALPDWRETGLAEARHPDFVVEIGDVVLARRDFGTSYHLSVVVDDAHQGITEVTRGLDLAEATPIHLILQALLGLSSPAYHHHRLIRDDTGRRLAKRDDARAIRRYREDGMSAAEVRALVGF